MKWFVPQSHRYFCSSACSNGLVRTMSPAFLFTKLFQNKKISAFPTTNPAALLQINRLFLRGISSNTSCAQPPSKENNPSASAVGSESSKKSSNVTKKEVNRDYTVSYLIESCGLSPKDAASASEKLHFSTPERPDPVLNLLRNHSFTRTQITTTVRKYPRLLMLNAEKILLPKLEFLLSTGLSRDVIAQKVSYNPELLTMSLKNQMEPACNFIKNVVQSDKRVCTAIKNSSRIIHTDHEKILVPNVGLLQKLGVPGSVISLLLTHYPGVLSQHHEQFSAVVSRVKEMGFNPSKSNFALAVHAISGKGSKLVWDRCYKIYSTKWGWSEDDILSAFKKHPNCMIMSEKRLSSAMEYLVNTMGWSSKCIAQQPIVLLYSLEKRIIPRCSVIRVLWRKGLVRKDLILRSILDPVERDFLKRYVTEYEEQVPQLLRVYKGEMDAKDL